MDTPFVGRDPSLCFRAARGGRIADSRQLNLTSASSRLRLGARKRRAARRGEPLVVQRRFSYLIMNFCESIDVLPLMSVASHRNVVVSVMWNTSPGSRGPVESQSGDDAFGLDPSVV